MAAALWVAKEVGMRKDKRGEKNEPWWKRRTEMILPLKNKYQETEKERRGETGAMGKIKIKELNTKYRLKKKGINMVIEELKEGLIANKTKIKRYEQTMSQFRQI